MVFMMVFLKEWGSRRGRQQNGDARQERGLIWVTQTASALFAMAAKRSTTSDDGVARRWAKPCARVCSHALADQPRLQRPSLVAKPGTARPPNLDCHRRWADRPWGSPAVLHCKTSGIPRRCGRLVRRGGFQQPAHRVASPGSTSGCRLIARSGNTRWPPPCPSQTTTPPVSTRWLGAAIGGEWSCRCDDQQKTVQGYP